MADAIDNILAERRKKAEQDVPERFFSILRGEGLVEEFFEMRFRNGTVTCFCYKDLSWFNYSPDEGLIDLEFSGFLITIKGRGLVPKLFDAIKNKRIAWIREADSDMHDNKELDNFIESIFVTPPDGFGSDERQEGEA